MTILAFSAKGHLDLALATLEDFGAAMSKVQVSGIVGRLQVMALGRFSHFLPLETLEKNSLAVATLLGSALSQGTCSTSGLQ